jgi:hypothetical protein
MFCACAALSGLDPFSVGGDAGETHDAGPSLVSDTAVVVPRDMSAQDTGPSTGEGDGPIADQRANDASVDLGPDGSSDAAGQGDASDGGAGDGSDADAGRPVCSSSNCGGCCDTDGNCVGGQSNATCGTGGETCVNCGSQSCNGGKCSSVTPDAGKCTASSCDYVTLCIPVYQFACCKSDGTCGCNINFPPGPCL